MNGNAPRLKFWLLGLLAFAIVIALGAPLEMKSAFGIADHQLAGSAARVDEIQGAWQAGGVFTLGMIAMFADLLFIGIYSFGAWIAGRSFMQMEQAPLRLLGIAACVSALIFCLTDYTETVLQVIQMVQGAGSDWMAATATTVRPIKMATFLISAAAIVLGIVVHRAGRAAS